MSMNSSKISLIRFKLVLINPGNPHTAKNH